MRILITGFIALVIWSFLTMWLYVDILKPATRKQVLAEPVVVQNTEADSLAKLYASMPEDILFSYEFDNVNFVDEPGLDSRIADFKSWLTKYPASMITVTGNTDFIGTDEYNDDLGLKRATLVGKFLQDKGIPADRMIISSMGEKKPVASHITSAGRAKNRRTVVSIKK